MAKPSGDVVIVDSSVYRVGVDPDRAVAERIRNAVADLLVMVADAEGKGLEVFIDQKREYQANPGAFTRQWTAYFDVQVRRPL